VVWLVMRQAKPVPVACVQSEPARQVQYDARPGDNANHVAAQPAEVADASLAAMQPDADTAAAAQPPPADSAATTEASAVVESNAVPAVSAPVLVQTEAAERVDVLVKSKPSGARIYRLGREIGRTPAVIQIGRGERRVFEVGTPALGTKRVPLDGEKTEVMVTLVADAPAAQPAAAPAPLEDRMRERLR
jgi:hypothetical protein